MAVVALASAGSLLAAGSGTTSLRITYWKNSGHAASRVVWTLHCGPPGGSLKQPARACAHIAAGGVKLFAPVAHDVVCTQIYGGPQKARVVGTVLGKHLWATFTRTDGCQISRWRKLSPWLVPASGIS